MANLRPIVLSGVNRSQLSSADFLILGKTAQVFNGATLTMTNAHQYLEYVNVGTTDANGRVTFNLTLEGTAGGTALFSSILNPDCLGQSANTSVIEVPFFYLESVAANLKTITFRGVRGSGVLVGGNSLRFLPAGFTANCYVKGVRAIP